MKKYKYVGVFISRDGDGNKFELSVTCNGFLEAFFLLTADAIKSGRHYQLCTITDEKGDKRFISDIMRCRELIN